MTTTDPTPSDDESEEEISADQLTEMLLPLQAEELATQTFESDLWFDDELTSTQPIKIVTDDSSVNPPRTTNSHARRTILMGNDADTGKQLTSDEYSELLQTLTPLSQYEMALMLVMSEVIWGVSAVKDGRVSLAENDANVNAQLTTMARLFPAGA